MQKLSQLMFSTPLKSISDENMIQKNMTTWNNEQCTKKNN